MQLNTLSYVHNVCMCTREPIEYRQKRNLKYLNIHEHTHSKCVYGGCTCVAYFRIGIGIIFSVWDCRSLLLANHIRKLSWIITTLYVIVTIWPLFKWKVRLFSVFSRHFSFCVCFCFRIFISKRKLFIYVSIYYSFYGTCTSELNTTDSTHYKWSAPLTLGQICFFFWNLFFSVFIIVNPLRRSMKLFRFWLLPQPAIKAHFHLNKSITFRYRLNYTINALTVFEVIDAVAVVVVVIVVAFAYISNSRFIQKRFGEHTFVLFFFFRFSFDQNHCYFRDWF